MYIHRVGQNHTFIGIYIGVHTVFLAGKLQNIRSYTVYIYGSGQPYILYISEYRRRTGTLVRVFVFKCAVEHGTHVHNSTQ
jgi:hypothetical protein